jgi:hypothetical protein
VPCSSGSASSSHAQGGGLKFFRNLGSPAGKALPLARRYDVFVISNMSHFLQHYRWQLCQHLWQFACIAITSAQQLMVLMQAARDLSLRTTQEPHCCCCHAGL